MKLLCLLLSFSFITLAQMTSNEVRTIENNLNEIDGPDGEFESQNCCSTEDALKETMLQCVQDLCGSPSEVDSVYVSNSDFEENIKDRAIEKEYNKTKPNLLKVVNQERDKGKKIIDRIKKNLENDNYLDTKAMSGENASKLIFKFLDESSWYEVEKDADGNKTVKLEFWDEDVKKHFENTIPVAEKLILENFENSFSLKVQFDYYNKKEAKEYILEMHKIASARVEKLKQEKPEYYQYNQANFDLYLNLDGLDDVEEMYNYIMYFDKLNSAIEETNANLDSQETRYAYEEKKYSCDNSSCRDELQNYVNSYDIAAKVAELEEQYNDDEYVDEFVKQCKNTWYSDVVLSVPEDKKEFVQKQLPIIKQNILDNFVTPLSDESRIKTEDYLNNLTHHYGIEPTPNDAEDENSESAVNELNGYLADYDENNYEPYYEDGTAQIYIDINEIDDFFNFANEAVLAGDLRNYCRDQIFKADDYFMPVDEEDQANGEIPYVHSSAFSCTHYTQGKQIIVHEFGHALSHFFSTKKISEESYKYYMNARNCVSSNHLIPRESSGGGFSHEGDHLYSEEDMADYFAYKIFPNEKRNLLFCSLIAPNDEGTEWSIDDIAVVHEPDYPDTHSTGLTRAIMEAIYKGVVPSQSCKDLMNHYKDEIRFNKCE